MIPQRSPWLYDWFVWYVKRYQLRKCFTAVRLDEEAPLPHVPDHLPMIVVLNHASWWDPLVCMVANELFPKRIGYAPIDMDMLKKYSIFGKLGFFGVEQGTLWGAREFLNISEAILKLPQTGLWITAQGDFFDVRSRPIKLRGGMGYLLHRMPKAIVIPLAIEYTFWNEKTPEVLLRFGQAIETDGSSRRHSQWTTFMEEKLAQTMDELAQHSIKRSPKGFKSLVEGKVGVGGIYDLWRGFTARLRGQRFSARHDERNDEIPGTQP